MAIFNKFDARHHLPSFSFLLVAATAAVVLATVFIYAGLYNIGADAPTRRSSTRLSTIYATVR